MSTHTRAEEVMGNLVGYDYEITYKPGHTNSAADTLSRVHGSPTLDATFVQPSTIWSDIKALYNDVMYLQRIGQLVTTNPWKPYEWRNDLLCYHNQVVIPPQSTLTAQLLHEHHDTSMGGHSGVLRTYNRLAEQYYWRAIHQAVRFVRYVRKPNTHLFHQLGCYSTFLYPIKSGKMSPRLHRWT
ncbi:hypothetical protein YC2023_037254 [Brassica napus]